MSNPVGKIDILHYTSNDTVAKLGEITLNDDYTLEGFLFENETLRRVTAWNPDSVGFNLVIHPGRPTTKLEGADDGG